MKLDINLIKTIENAWVNKELLADDNVKSQIYEIINILDCGGIRSAEKINGQWRVDEIVKKAILLYFRIQDIEKYEVGPFKFIDKIPLKQEFNENVRVVPPAVIRHGAFAESGVVFMSFCYANIGSFIGKGTMIDSHALIGSCAQIGEGCHISAHTMIGGVLEPVQASPVIIEDNCFIGANCNIAEGVIVKEGSVIAAGTTITASSKIYDATEGELRECPSGIIPEGKVVIQGSVPHKTIPGLNVSAIILIKNRDKRTDAKTVLEEALR